MHQLLRRDTIPCSNQTTGNPIEGVAEANKQNRLLTAPLAQAGARGGGDVGVQNGGVQSAV